MRGYMSAEEKPGRMQFYPAFCCILLILLLCPAGCDRHCTVS
ncbi:MAG: hypothetical protein A4E34_02592 [Methanoregula sp. PtaU1.Bin006]|nr:MAG: hypothetical protein A4E33_00342 [Methanoregula sp. PtaB.Bin085]OPY32218.1 MAG: hypothetical protein A4E34_02592 [Methanoregula sp. PtaU1.Bin006]